MAIEMMGAIKAHVMTHLGGRLRAHLLDAFVHDMGGRVATANGRKVGRLGADCNFWISDMYEELDTGKARRDVPDCVRTRIAELRGRLGLSGNKRISKMTRLTDAVFKLHIELSRHAEARFDPGEPEDDKEEPRTVAKAFSACPVVKTHRTFAYLDHRVLKGMLSGFQITASKLRKDTPDDQMVAEAFGADEASWNAASKHARRMRRTNRDTLLLVYFGNID
jgi:hypothetical protein